MDAKQFALAVAPIVLADVALDLLQLYVAGDSEPAWASWVLVAISFIVFPAWAGARVVRRGGSWPWTCVAGLCVLIGTLVLATIIEPSTLDMPPIIVLGIVLVLVPVYALFGFLGGKLFGRGRIPGT